MLPSEKSVREAAFAKLDSNIVLALKQGRGEPPFDRATTLQPSLTIRPGGLVLVDLTATVSGELLEQIAAGKGTVINHFATARAVRALVPLSRMEALARRADVQFVALAAEPVTQRVDPARSLPPDAPAQP